MKIGGNEGLIYRAVLAKAGVDKAKLNEIRSSLTSPCCSPVRSTCVARIPHQRGSGGQEKGFDVNVVSLPDYGIDLYADTLFTTEKMLKDKPDVVRKFVGATCVVGLRHCGARRGGADYGEVRDPS